MDSFIHLSSVAKDKGHSSPYKLLKSFLEVQNNSELDAKQWSHSGI